MTEELLRQSRASAPARDRSGRRHARPLAAPRPAPGLGHRQPGDRPARLLPRAPRQTRPSRPAPERGLELEAASASELLEDPRTALVGSLLEALGITEPLEIEFFSGVPFGSGLGGSSALTVALAGALERFAAGAARRRGPRRLRARRRDARARQARRGPGLLPAARGRPAPDRLRGGPHALAAGGRGSGGMGAPPDALRHGRLALLRHEQLGDLPREARRGPRGGGERSRRSAAPPWRWRRPVRGARLSRRWAGRSARSGTLGGGSRRSFRRRRSRGRSPPRCQAGAWAGKACGAGGGGCVVFLSPADEDRGGAAALSRCSESEPFCRCRAENQGRIGPRRLVPAASDRLASTRCSARAPRAPSLAASRNAVQPPCPGRTHSNGMSSRLSIERICSLPRVPAGVAEGDERAAAPRPGEVIAGEEELLPVEEHRVAARVSGRRESRGGPARGRPARDPRGAARRRACRRCASSSMQDPLAAEAPMEGLVVGDVVPVRQEHRGDAAAPLELARAAAARPSANRRGRCRQGAR